MFEDPSDEDPDDPYADLGDPEAQFGLPGSDDVDVPPALRGAFWRLVVVVNVGLLATALGAMLLAFRGQLVVGGAGLAIGIGSLVYGVVRYRRDRDRGFGLPGE